MQHHENIDAHQLALLPITWLAEQSDPFEHCTQSGIGDNYRAVFRNAIWIYSLYTFLNLVARRRGADFAQSLWPCQRQILAGDAPEVARSLDNTLELLQTTDRLCRQLKPADTPYEQTFAVALLFNLPGSPDFNGLPLPEGARLTPDTPGADLELARCLTQARQDVERTFAWLTSSHGATIQ